jgi:hypothetical protein
MVPATWVPCPLSSTASLPVGGARDEPERARGAGVAELDEVGEVEVGAVSAGVDHAELDARAGVAVVLPHVAGAGDPHRLLHVELELLLAPDAAHLGELLEGEQLSTAQGRGEQHPERLEPGPGDARCLHRVQAGRLVDGHDRGRRRVQRRVVVEQLRRELVVDRDGPVEHPDGVGVRCGSGGDQGEDQRQHGDAGDGGAAGTARHGSLEGCG